MKRGFTNRYYTGGGSREAPALSRRRAILEDKKECRKFTTLFFIKLYLISIRLFLNHHFLRLAVNDLDVKTVLRISYLYTLEVEVNSLSILSLDCRYT